MKKQEHEAKDLIEKMADWAMVTLVFAAFLLLGMIVYLVVLFFYNEATGEAGEGDAASAGVETNAIAWIDGNWTVSARQVGEGRVEIHAVKTDGQHGKGDASDVAHNQLMGAAAAANAVNGCARSISVTQALQGVK